MKARVFRKTGKKKSSGGIVRFPRGVDTAQRGISRGKSKVGMLP